MFNTEKNTHGNVLTTSIHVLVIFNEELDKVLKFKKAISRIEPKCMDEKPDAPWRLFSLDLINIDYNMAFSILALVSSQDSQGRGMISGPIWKRPCYILFITYLTMAEIK